METEELGQVCTQDSGAVVEMALRLSSTENPVLRDKCLGHLNTPSFTEVACSPAVPYATPGRPPRLTTLVQRAAELSAVPVHSEGLPFLALRDRVRAVTTGW